MDRQCGRKSCDRRRGGQNASGVLHGGHLSLPPVLPHLRHSHISKWGTGGRKFSPSPCGRGLGGGVSRNIHAKLPLPLTPSRKGIGRIFYPAAMCECRRLRPGVAERTGFRGRRGRFIDPCSCRTVTARTARTVEDRQPPIATIMTLTSQIKVAQAGIGCMRQ